MERSATLNRVTSRAEIGRVVDRVKLESDLASAVQALIPEIRALKTSRDQLILASLLLPLFVGLILALVNPIANYYVARALTSEHKQIPQRVGFSAGHVEPALPIKRTCVSFATVAR